jgi:TonB-linked SusC/RagA family outer membrane protein
MTKQLIAKVAAIAMILATGLLGGNFAFAQNGAINGKVVDASGEPIIGAAVVVPGTSNGVTTDLDGNFSIRVASGTTLEVSCIGYVTRRVAAAANMVVSLEDDAEMLEETVVIGYGVQRKSDLTGSVASVRSEDLQNRSTTDAAAALQGKAAGVQILNNSGRPGAGAEIRVRGYSSNSGNIGPLLIVDGLKVDNIQYLDPSMIESMEVLKDAASAAIYGAQAGNGVVLITTKQGKDGHSSITYDLKMTSQRLGKKAELLNATDYIAMQKAIGNLNDDIIKSNRWDGQDHNWYDAVFNPSWSAQHAITFQGGNKNGHFFTSLNYLNNDGIVVGKKDVYKRLTAQINADYQIKKWLQVGTNNSIERWSTSQVSEGYGSALNSMISLDPLTPAYYSRVEDMTGAMQAKYATNPDLIYRDPDHNNDFYASSAFYQEATGNPLLQRSRKDESNSGITVRGTLFANFTPFTGFTFTSRFGYRISQSASHSYNAPYYGGNDMAKDDNYSISANINTGYYYQWENFANYSRNFGKHYVNAMAGMSYVENNWDNASISAQSTDPLRAYEPNFRYIDYIKSDVTKNTGNAPGKSVNMSYYGRLIYTFDDRYSIQANFRADAFDSSKLSEQVRWGYFPSVSAYWTVSNESFIRDNISRDILSFFKIRASWGRNGNVDILNNYPYASTISLNSQWYQYSPGEGNLTYGSGPTSIANPGLHWEVSEQIDLGFDARLFNNRLTFGFDWYKKNTKDLLVQVTPRPELGVKNSYQNAGNVLNTGFEFELGWKDTVGDFSYSINANLATNHNEVTDLHFSVPRIEETPVSGLNNVNRSAFEIGYPIWYFMGCKYEGVNPENGMPRYMTATGDIKEGSPSDDDKYFYLGKPIPDATYGLTVNLAWRNFDFTMYGTGTIGNDIFTLMWSADRTQGNTLSYFWKNSWTANNKNAPLPDMAKVAKDWKFWSSNAAMFDGSFFKIKQIQLGYTLPQNLTRKAAIDNLRLYISLDDFITFTKYPGADPETATTGRAKAMGYDSGTYPTMKKIVFGVNLTF